MALNLFNRYLLATFLTVLSPSLARAGGSDGGAAVLACRDYSMLLDLWDAQNITHLWEPNGQMHTLDIPENNYLSVTVQALGALEKLRRIEPTLYPRVFKDLMFVMDQKNHEKLPDKIRMEPPPDAKAEFSEGMCPVVGMFRFRNEGDVSVLTMKERLFNSLKNNTHIAASWTHEAIYKAYRDLVIEDTHDSDIDFESTAVRRINACLYSPQDCFGLSQPISLPKDGRRVLSCKSKSLEYYAFEEKNDRYRPYPDSMHFRIKFLLKRINNYHYKIPLEGFSDLSFSTIFSARHEHLAGGMYPGDIKFRNAIFLKFNKFEFKQPVRTSSFSATPYVVGSIQNQRLELDTFQLPPLYILSTKETVPTEDTVCTPLEP